MQNTERGKDSVFTVEIAVRFLFWICVAIFYATILWAYETLLHHPSLRMRIDFLLKHLLEFA
jgi:hypothetical protein